jgi:hypothetical protein
MYTVGRSAASETKEVAISSIRIRDARTPTTLGTFALTDRKRRMMVIHLDRLALYEEAAWDERP